MTETTEPKVHVRRTIAAPVDRVYRAWLDPRTMTRWFAPATFRCTAAEVDERVGGRMSIHHSDDAGTDMGGAEAEILELVPDERIVLAWNFVGADRVIDPDTTSTLTIALASGEDGHTLLDLTHEGLVGLRARMPQVADGVQPGWESAVDNLESALGGGDA